MAAGGGGERAGGLAAGLRAPPSEGQNEGGKEQVLSVQGGLHGPGRTRCNGTKYSTLFLP
jgi:hypothetical protein